MDKRFRLCMVVMVVFIPLRDVRFCQDPVKE